MPAKKKSTNAKRKSTSKVKKSTKAKEPLAESEPCAPCPPPAKALPPKFDLTHLNIIQNVQLLDLMEAYENVEQNVIKSAGISSMKNLRKEWFRNTQLTLEKIPQETKYFEAILQITKLRLNILMEIKDYLEKARSMSDQEYVEQLIKYMEEKELGWVDINSIPPNICKLLYEWACKNKKLNRTGWAFPLKACAEKGGCKYEGCECTNKEESSKKEPWAEI